MSGQVATYRNELWLMIAGMAAVTFMSRAGLLLLSNRYALPVSVQRALKFAPASALAAIVAPDLLMLDGQVAWSLDNVRLYAGLCGFAAVVLTRNGRSLSVNGTLEYQR